MVNRITLFLALATMWITPQLATAQHLNHPGCGTTLADQELIKERMFENRRNKSDLLAAFDLALATRTTNDSTLWVPVVFHMCAKADGTGQQSDAWVLREMCYFNENYADQNIQFYLVNINRFNSNQMYVNEPNSSDYIRSIHRVNNAINIYVAGPAQAGTQYGAYYAPNWDWIFTWNDIYSWGLSHEVGHLFTLAHTFNGWEGTDYATESASSGKAPMMGTNGRPVEKVARGTSSENCQYAADGFCDTPPDYASGGGGCNMPSDWYDSDSVLVVVDNSANPLNFMSYFFCTSAATPSGKMFTSNQKEAIKLDVIRRYNQAVAAPSPLLATGAPTLTWPSQGALAPYTSEPVHFTWTDNNNHGVYLLKVERTISNGSIVVSTVTEKVVYGTEAWVTLAANQEFRWSVEAITRYDVCRNSNNVSAPAIFNTANWALSTEELNANIQNSSIYPNPAGRNSEVILEIEVPFSGEAQISISNMLGQNVMPSQQLNLISGKNLEHINIRDLSAGVYFVNIESGKTRISHKLMIQD